MKKLRISKTLSLPVNYVTQTAAILAKRRVGKTYTASVIAEELVKQGMPWVAIDPTGAWWGIRSSADGKHEGFPVVIIGGAHGDVPLEPTAGKVIADLVVDHPGCYVIDLSGTESDAAQDRFAEDFALRLYRRKDKQREPLHLFVDEADMFAPQRPFPNQTRMLGAFEALVRRGGIRGVGVTMITQRPAILNKNVLSQIDTLFVLRITSPQDQDAVKDWVKRHSTPAQVESMMQDLAPLATGQCWVWSPEWLEMFEKIEVRERETFNSSATPKPGEKAIVPGKLAPVDIERLGKEIQATIEQAKANDPAEIKRQLAAALKRIAELEKRPVSTPVVETKIVRVPVFEKDEVKGLLDAIGELQAATGSINRAVDKADTYAKLATNGHAPKPAIRLSPVAQVAKLVERPRTPAPTSNGGESVKLPKGEKEIMKAVAQYPEGASREQLTRLTGYKRSSRDAYINRLQGKGYVNKDLTPTQAGIDALGHDYEPLPTGDDLIRYWLDRLPEGERIYFEIAVEARGEYVTKEDADSRTHYKRSSRDAYLNRLQARKLIDTRPGAYRAAPGLFWDGR